MATPTPGPLSRFLRFTTQEEPVLSAATLVAIALAIVSRFVPLTDDDLQLLALILLPFAPAVLARLKAWSPASVQRLRAQADERLSEAYRDGHSAGYEWGRQVGEGTTPAPAGGRRGREAQLVTRAPATDRADPHG